MKQLAIVLFAALTACVMPASQPGYDPVYAQTSYAGGIYINGQLLTSAEEARLEELLGEQVPAGRYVLDADGNFGYEGRGERVNLVAYIRARQQQHGGGGDGESNGGTMMHDRSDGSTMVGYGDCVAMSTPTATFLGSGC